MQWSLAPHPSMHWYTHQDFFHMFHIMFHILYAPFFCGWRRMHKRLNAHRTKKPSNLKMPESNSALASRKWIASGYRSLRQNSSPGSNSGNAADGTANAAGAGANASVAHAVEVAMPAMPAGPAARSVRSVRSVMAAAAVASSERRSRIATACAGPVGPAGAAFGAVPVPGHQSWAAADAADADAVSGETDQDETLDTFHGTTLGTWHDTKLTSANSLGQSSTTPQQARSFIMIQTVPLKSIECHWCFTILSWQFFCERSLT